MAGGYFPTSRRYGSTLNTVDCRALNTVDSRTLEGDAAGKGGKEMDGKITSIELDFDHCGRYTPAYS